jgi:hypothetical protein
MASEICIAVYRAKPGKEEELAALIEGHVAVLQAEGLATDRTPIVMRSPDDGTFLEVFEWVAPEASCEAHANAKVGPLWGQMMEIADFLTLADVPEAVNRFPHFRPA